MPLDPDSQYGSGSTKSLNPDPIRIRIHNPDSEYIFQAPGIPLSSSSSSSSSSSTELGSTSTTNSSEATFIILEEGEGRSSQEGHHHLPSSNSQRTAAAKRSETLNLSYSHWLEALFIALKYRYR
jgi:hypothetical protein